jgi:hypothetical protein
MAKEDAHGVPKFAICGVPVNTRVHDKENPALAPATTHALQRF